MISALSAYKAMILESRGGNDPLREKSPVAAGSVPYGVEEHPAADADLVNISASQDVFSAVDNFFNLGTSDRFGAFHKLSPKDKEQFVQIVADLAKAGYMGYEELVVNKKVERHDLENKIGDQRIRGARVYDNAKDTHR
ncbi:hypothetical protein KP001_10740 [Geomonas subterranea]|uniref:Uncharacterized protein n=1 Tax=Geomonas subterranea TaxID=2847989 RepID=A0ABX8LLN3_9BACT|nr:hypothetical protein [Geomonas subterranea]QXE92958.1 hypothetical protein KP001_10740 [Geomonas subterranea]QXM08936.1 hypothetical protein KP002_18535 [Geomonas subterranea]